MTDMFFFGTLRHIPLLELVLGRSAEQLRAINANLPDYVVHWVQDQPFPILAPAGGGMAVGLLVRNLSDEDVARINFYEGGFDYDLRTCSVVTEDGSDHSAEVYFARPGIWTPGAVWSLEDWVRDWGQMTLFAAAEVMSYFGTKSTAEVAAMFPMIRGRAWSNVMARTKPSGQAATPEFTESHVTIDKRWRPYVNFFALDELNLSFQRFDGSRSATVNRAVFVSTDAVMVLPYDPVRDCVLLVEQMRMGPIGRRDPYPWMLQPIAGLLDAGETPENCARREAVEEAGLQLGALEKIGQFYPSPGASTEYFHLFAAVTDLPDDVVGVAGLDSEGENIRSHLVSFDALMQMVDDHSAASADLAFSALWLARHRERLRANA